MSFVEPNTKWTRRT